MPATTNTDIEKALEKSLAGVSDLLTAFMVAQITADQTGDTTMLQSMLQSLPPPTLYRFAPPRPSFSPEAKQRLREKIQALTDYSKSLIKQDAPGVQIEAGKSGLNLADNLLDVLDDDDRIGDKHSDFERVLKQGYQDMSENRRLGYFHSFLVAISSVLRSIINLICPTTNTQRNTSVKIGEISLGFFGRTSRQELVIDIHKAFNEAVDPPASNDSDLSY